MGMHKVIGVRELTESTFVVSLERKEMKFVSGQYVMVGKAGSIDKREYSIYSGEQDKYLEILVKEVDDGFVSRQLKRLRKNEIVEVDGPYGYFGLKGDPVKDKHIFIATGTGISPFHSMVKSRTNLNYTLYHGVRHAHEAYDRSSYINGHYQLCGSKDENADFTGRVTERLQQEQVDKKAYYYLCGNSDMINEVWDLLKKKGVNPRQINAEVYF